jgi:mono/diheme cytochrome c family protein
MRGALLTALFGGLILVSGCSSTGSAPPASGGGPAAAPAAATAGGEGAQLFASHCANCHGADGRSGKAPSLAAAGKGDEAALRSVIMGGRGKMPSFQGRLSDQQMTSLIAHLKGLGG